MAIELEAKFRASGEQPLLHLARVARLGPAVLGPARAVAEVDRYLDTADGRLAAARWACRLRSRDGGWRVSLKGPPAEATDGAAMHGRPEVEGPARDDLDPATWPGSRARDFVLELAGGQPLEERLRLLQSRTERSVTLPGIADPVALLTLDRVRVERAGREMGALDVVELEQVPHAEPDALPPLVAALAEVPGLMPDPMTKLEHALELIGQR